MSSIVAAVALTAVAAGYTAYQSKKAKDDAKDQFKKQEAAAAAQVQKAKLADKKAKQKAKKVTRKRQAAINTSGRPSTFSTSMFGLSDAAPVKKKKLGS